MAEGFSSKTQSGAVSDSGSQLRTEGVSGLLRIPKDVLHINLLDKCNLQCIHCSEEASPSQNHYIDRGTVMSLFSSLDGIGINRVVFMGGEPLLYPNVDEFIYTLNGMGKEVKFDTNGTIVPKFIDNIPKSVVFRVSLEGGIETNDRVRGDGNFRKVIRNIGVFRDKGFRSGIRMTMFPFTKESDMDELARIVKAYDLDLLKVGVIQPIGRSVNPEIHEMPVKHYLRLAESIREISEKYGIKIKLCGDAPWVPGGISEKWQNRIKGDIFTCRAAEGYFVNVNGDVTPCRFLTELKVGNVHKTSLAEIHKSKKAKKLESLDGNETCKSCDELEGCKGGCRERAYAAFDDYNAPDPSCPVMQKGDVYRY